MPIHKTLSGKYALLVLLLMAVYFPLFLHMDYMPFRMWDESIMANNALEMSKSHHYIVATIFGEPDMGNTKPPLLLWCMQPFIKLLGFNEISIRMPSALAALGLCLYLFFVLGRYARSYLFSFFVVLALVTFPGYVRNHVIRTGEYDSLLVLFTTAFSFELFLATEAGDKKQQSKHLLAFFVLLTLAVLTKGIACMMLGPGLLLYVVFRKKLLAFLKNPSSYIGLAVFLVFGVGFYFLRESMNPGYLNAVWMNELGGRFAATNEGHTGPFGFYFSELWAFTLGNWKYLLPAILLVALFFTDNRLHRLSVFALVTGLLFMLVVSSAATKLTHYDAPLFPFLAVLTGAFLLVVYEGLKGGAGQLSPNTGSWMAFFTTLTLVSIFYFNNAGNFYFPKGDWWEEDYSQACRTFHNVAKDKNQLPYYHFVVNNYGNQLGERCVYNCYLEMMTNSGKKASITGPDSIAAGDKIILFREWPRDDLARRFTLIPLQPIGKEGWVYYDVQALRTDSTTHL